jgi:hypothetical protein
LENNGIEYDEEKLTTEWEEKDKYMYESDLDLFIEENCPELKECSYSWEYVYHNHFLTEKGCKEHIQRNHYHYNEPVDYLNHAWRNPEMDLISEFLCGLVGKKIHT